MCRTIGDLTHVPARQSPLKAVASQYIFLLTSLTSQPDVSLWKAVECRACW